MSLNRVLIILFALFFLGPTISLAQELLENDIYSVFAQANDAFRQANSLTNDPAGAQQLYNKAILLYEKIINQGKIQNAKLYYNLANTYLLNEDIGRAILNYRRAEMLDDSNVDIKKNLAFARSRTIDKVPVTAEKKVLQTLFFWHYDFSLRTKFILTCIFIAGLCIALTYMIWIGRSLTPVVISVILAVVTISFLLSIIIESGDRTTTVYGVITVEQVIARQGDGMNYPESFKDPLHAGTEFKLAESRPGWFHIILSDGSNGWIADNSAELI
jgi:tetratricopeptide (TPR) repeat protein